MIESTPSTPNSSIKLLDTTLRDGSYAIDFKFSSEQTATICSGLDIAGVDLIEVGHGIGLNASNSGQGQAAETVEDYMTSAADSVNSASWGMFAIPGV